MPVSKYKCTDCGKEFAKIYFNLEDAPRKCPVCEATNLEELGAAFDYDIRQLQRLSCTSCDSCSEETGCAIVVSS